MTNLEMMKGDLINQIKNDFEAIYDIIVKNNVML